MERPPLKLGTHPRHPDRPAILDEAGHAVATFATGASREEIADNLASAGYVLHPDDTVTKAAPIGATSRRALFAGAAGAALAGCALVMRSPAKAAGHDGELRALTDELAAIHLGVQASDDGESNESWPDFDALLDDFWRVADQIELLPATCPEGVQAKARALQCVIGCAGWDANCPTARHTASLLRDMLREGAP